MSKFLNLDEPLIHETKEIGSGLKKRAKKPRPDPDKAAVARAGEVHGFTRATETKATQVKPRRGRPPLNDTMTYWRIYIAPDLRDELNALRDMEGRRLNDVLKDMVRLYKKQKP